MDYNILIGGAAGQGMDTVAHLLTKVMQRNGFYVYTTADYMSRVRGGHNFFQIRISDRPIHCHKRELDMIFALNAETLERHLPRLKAGGMSFCDDSIEGFPETKKYNLIKKAKELGNEKMLTSVGLAIIIRYLGLNLDHAKEVLRSKFKPELIDMNIEALRYGYELLESDNKREAGELDTILIDGNSAVGLGAVAAGCKLYCAYPMTPSSGVLGFMAAASEEMEIAVDQVEDEVAALNMALGAAYTGVRAMTGSSGGGLALMQEAMSLAGIIETPIVVINVQRPGPATGLPTNTEQSDLRFLVHSGHGEFPRKIIAFRNAEDAFYQTVRAFDIAEKYQIPVILLSDQYLADANVNIEPFDLESIEIDRHLANPKDYEPGTYNRYAFTESGVSPRLIPGRANGNIVMVDSDEHNEFGRIDESAENRIKMVDKRAKKGDLVLEESEDPWEIGVDDFDTLVVCWGSTYGIVKEAVEALNEEGHKIKALSYADVFPLKVDKFLEYHKKAKKYIMVEQNHDGQFEGLIRQYALVKADHLIRKYDGRAWYLEELKAELEEVL
ncbi:MAG: 2-oxoacid:acceptor oxidoreductase subunit alpha [Tissierellia bacterium]|nr:2-oxoacid:acceptor oxidoreductase subunit alpha [Tissierellia bacterium]